MRKIPSSRCLCDHASTSYLSSWIHNALGFNGRGYDDGSRGVALQEKGTDAHLMEEAYCYITKHERTVRVFS